MQTIQDLLNIELPIIQAPMAGVQGSAMTVAVSNAGGLGSLPCAMLSLELMREELQAITAQTSKPYNVNFFCHTPPVMDANREKNWQRLLAPYYDEFGIDITTVTATQGRAPFTSEAADVISEFKPPVVSFHFGLPADDLMQRVKSWGAKILSSATTVEEACWLEQRGVDAIIVQGSEAGGHRGMFLTDDLSTQTGTFELLHAVQEKVKLPLIAAGGIVDAKGVSEAMSQGAAGVQIGTAYLLCDEATTSTVHRAALKSESAQQTGFTNVFTGRPARGIVNRLMRELGAVNKDAPAFPLAASAIAPLRAHTEKQGSGDFSPLWCGENTKGCKEIPAAELTRELAAGLKTS